MNDGALLDLLLVSRDDQLGLFDLGFEPLDFRQRFGKNLSSVLVAGFQLFEQCLVFDNELSMPLDFAIVDRHDPAPLNDRPRWRARKRKTPRMESQAAGFFHADTLSAPPYYFCANSSAADVFLRRAENRSG
jgi:hypothetical protein